MASGGRPGRSSRAPSWCRAADAGCGAGAGSARHDGHAGHGQHRGGRHPGGAAAAYGAGPALDGSDPRERRGRRGRRRRGGRAWRGGRSGCSSEIPLRQRRVDPELGERLAGLALDGAGGDPEQLGGLGLGEVLEVAEHHHRPLPPGQPAERVPQVAGLAGARRRGGRCSGSSSVGLLAVPPAAPPAGVGGDEDPADVRLGVALDAAPGQVGLGQRRLQQVLGEAVVAGQQVGGAQQPVRPGRHELLEARTAHRGPPRDRHRAHDRPYRSAGRDGCPGRATSSGARGTRSSPPAPPRWRTAAPTAPPSPRRGRPARPPGRG